MKDAFLIAWRSLWRGRTLWILLAAVVAAHIFLPGLARSDGTSAGRLEMHVRVVCGAVAALAYVSALALACGSFAREREDDLLPLSLVRPVSAFSIAAGRWIALVLLLTCILAVNAVLTNVVLSRSPYPPGDCRIHHAPALPPAEVTAASMMETFLKSDKTPEAVKKAPRAAVLALLTAKENERYEVIRPGQTVAWPFAVPVGTGPLVVRTRFSTLYNIKADLNGVFNYGALEGVVSNSTQAILETPLRAGKGTDPAAMWKDLAGLRPDMGTGPAIPLGTDPAVSFTNTGKTDVMLRPRRDVELLAPGDSFLANSVRATGEMLAMAGLLAAFGLFLSAALSRPVALFTAAVLLAAALMAPDAVSQFPDEFHATMGEKAGLFISRAVTRLTAALSEISPVSDLATGRAIASDALARTLAADLLAWPAFFLALAAFILRRKAK